MSKSVIMCDRARARKFLMNPYESKNRLKLKNQSKSCFKSKMMLLSYFSSKSESLKKSKKNLTCCATVLVSTMLKCLSRLTQLVVRSFAFLISHSIEGSNGCLALRGCRFAAVGQTASGKALSNGASKMLRATGHARI